MSLPDLDLHFIGSFPRVFCHACSTVVDLHVRARLCLCGSLNTFLGWHSGARRHDMGLHGRKVPSTNEPHFEIDIRIESVI